VDRDFFDKETGERLRRAEMPVPEGAWEAISREIGSSAGSSNFSFAGAAAVGIAVLGSLAVYSTFFRVQHPAFAEDQPIAKEQTAAESPTSEAADWSANKDEESTDQVISPAPEASGDKKAYSNENNQALKQSIHAVTKGKGTDGEVYEAEALSVNVDDLNTPITGIMLPESIPAATLPAPSVAETLRTAIAPTSAPAEPLRASIRAENLKGYAPFEIDFEAFGNFEDVQWDFGPYGNSIDVNTRRTFDRPGTYHVTLTAFGKDGRTITDMVTIEVREGSNLLVPDSFTPNGDGINDTFKAEGVNLVSYRLSVADARGNVVFETRNIDEPWVYSDNSSSELDAYFAIITAEGVDGKTYRIRQRINIIF